MGAKKSGGFTDEERAAMRERAKEQKAEARANKKRAEGEGDLLAKIAEMAEPDRAMAGRLHEIVKASAPALSPKTWYGMPAYANKDGKVICYFTPASKFKERYATFGFNATANLDEGAMWPTSFADGVDCHRRSKDQRAREESGELRMNPASVTTPNELEIRVERIFDAPRAHVFSVWTDPQLIPEWWGDGTVVEEMDVRPGGTYRFRTAFGVVEGEFREVDVPERLVQTFQNHLQTLEFEELGDRTKLTQTMRFATSEERDTTMQYGVEEGAKGGFARIDALLQRLPLDA